MDIPIEIYFHILDYCNLVDVINCHLVKRCNWSQYFQHRALMFGVKLEHPTIRIYILNVEEPSLVDYCFKYKVLFPNLTSYTNPCFALSRAIEMKHKDYINDFASICSPDRQFIEWIEYQYLEGKISDSHYAILEFYTRVKDFTDVGFSFQSGKNNELITPHNRINYIYGLISGNHEIRKNLLRFVSSDHINYACNYKKDRFLSSFKQNLII